MHGKTRNALLGYGLTSDLIEKIGDRGHTLTELRALSRQKLLGQYTSEEVDQIKASIDRTPIPEEVIALVVAKAGGACCYCGDGNNSRPVQIHHIAPYSETQDNSEENLLLVCPTHHVTIHANDVSGSEQKSVRRRWHATVKVASDFATKGLPFPFGTFQALDYGSDPKPAELIEFGPLSPSTALTCYPSELASEARTRLDSSSFLIVLGASGSGKSTYATAMGGLYGKAGFMVFQHRFGKPNHDSLNQVSLFVSACVREVVIILDDANTWATAADLQQIGKLVSGRRYIRIIATWTTDDSDDGSKLQASDLPKQVLTWADLRPAVVETLLKYEGEIVEALQKFERVHSVGSLGIGSLHSRLQDRILGLGDTPKTVYEFIFGLRGDTAVAEEFQQLVQDDRADVPVVHVALEQIAGFERPTSLEETVAACLRVERGTDLPPASPEWVQAALCRQVRYKRLVRVRDRFVTIHRRWAARLLAAGLASTIARSTTELLLKPDFQVGSASPERLLRLWSWLESLDGSRSFIKTWEKSLSPGEWTVLVRRSAKRGLMEVGFLARKMHLLFDTKLWTPIMAKAFEHNVSEIAPLVHGASPIEWYWLSQLSMAMEHACPNAWKQILQDWNRKTVACLLLQTPLEQFKNLWWALGDAKSLRPGWLEEVGSYVSWEDFSQRLSTVKVGDLTSLAEAFGVFGALGHKLKRSMLRRLTEIMRKALAPASIEDLRIPMLDSTTMLLCMVFPDDARSVFGSLDVQKIGSALGRSLPRHWRSLSEMNWLAHECGSAVCEQIIAACELKQLLEQVRRYGPSNRYELRLLLHFLCNATSERRRSFAIEVRDVVRNACQCKDSEAKSIITAYHRLDAELGGALVTEVGIAPEELNEKAEPESLEETRQEFRAKDATGADYEIEMGPGSPASDQCDGGSPAPSCTGRA